MDYGFYRHEWIEELQEISIKHAAFFKAELFPLWRASPGDTGERFGVIGKRGSFEATSACDEFYTEHFSKHNAGEDTEVAGGGDDHLASDELQAVLQVLLGRPLDDEELKQIGETSVDATSVPQIVSVAESFSRTLRTRAERSAQRADLEHKAVQAICDADGSVSEGKIERLVQHQNSKEARESCNHKPNSLTNPFQRSAAKWLASTMRLPACVAPVATDSEYQLFMELYMRLSENGKRGVNYKEMCNEWNSVVMAEMEDIKSVAGGVLSHWEND